MRLVQQYSTPNRLESSISWNTCSATPLILALLSDIFLIISYTIFCKSLPSTLLLLNLWDFALIFSTSLNKLRESWANLKLVSPTLWATARSRHFIRAASCCFWAAWTGISVSAFSLCCQCLEKNCFTVYSWKYSIMVEASAALFPLISSAGPRSCFAYSYSLGPWAS